MMLLWWCVHSFPTVSQHSHIDERVWPRGQCEKAAGKCLLATHLKLNMKDKKRNGSMQLNVCSQTAAAGCLECMWQLEVCQRTKFGDVAQDLFSVIATTCLEVKVQNKCCTVYYVWELCFVILGLKPNLLITVEFGWLDLKWRFSHSAIITGLMSRVHLKKFQKVSLFNGMTKNWLSFPCPY